MHLHARTVWAASKSRRKPSPRPLSRALREGVPLAAAGALQDFALVGLARRLPTPGTRCRASYSVEGAFMHQAADLEWRLLARHAPTAVA
jgi:hypothetical protein